MRMLEPETSREMPWANGRGKTIEIATDSSQLGDAWTWRLSIADLPQRAEFSRFPAIDRHIACLDGEGMRLQRTGRWIDVPTMGDAISFTGEESITGEPIGLGVRDVNWFLRRDRWTGGMRVTGMTSMTGMTGMTSMTSKHGATIHAALVVIHAVGHAKPLRVASDQQTLMLHAGCTIVASGSVTIEPHDQHDAHDAHDHTKLIIAWANPTSIPSPATSQSAE